MLSTTISADIGKLTSGQLERASADLRNAALVVKHAGHWQGGLVNRIDGRVCALSAIELATYKKLTYIGQPIADYISLTTERWIDRDLYRCDSAVIAFADFVPTGLCDLCDDEARERHIATECGTCTPRGPHDIVTHYNDSHCASGVLLTNMFCIAADRSMALAQHRRSLLASRLLATV